jgi:hypothetical protein
MLAPDIVAAIVDKTLSSEMMLIDLVAETPLIWDARRTGSENASEQGASARGLGSRGNSLPRRFQIKLHDLPVAEIRAYPAGRPATTRRCVMSLSNQFSVFSACMLVGVAFLPDAKAVPSYARQTGMPCAACHTTPPELTPFGRDFKINGYTLTGMQQIEAQGKGTQAGLKISEVPPLSAMLLTSFTHTSKDQPDTQNNDTSFPQELSLFFAGEITPHIGSFLQLTYAQEDDNLSLDNTDIRYANHLTVAGKDTIYGVTLNNSPTVEDPWNTTPVWGFPFISSDVAPTPAAAPLISDALAQEVAGLGGYMFWDNHLYADLTLYRSAQILGEGPGGAPSNESDNTIKNVTPYWRVAWEQKIGSNTLEVGTFGLWSELYPQGISGETDKYTDLAIDAQFEHPMGSNTLTLRGTYIHEHASLDGSVDDGLAANDSNTLETLNLNGTFHLGTKAAFSIGGFNTSGDKDKLLYPPDPVDGSANGSPDSRGWILQATYLPWQNTQFTLQYVGYSKFNGDDHNYDGSGRDASDNDTIYLAAWLVW